MAKAKSPALPDLVKKLALVMKALEQLEVKREPLRMLEDQLRESILTNFKHTQVHGLKAHGLSLSISKTDFPTLEDWGKFFKYASRKENQDLFQRKVMVDAWRARLDKRVVVPGTKPFKKVALRVSSS